MRWVMAAVCVVFVTGTAAPVSICADEFAAGIYRVVPDGQGKRVARSSGGTVDLGDRVSDNFGDVSLWSLSNQNDRFRVQMEQAGPVDGEGRLAIYVDGVCEVVGSTSGSPGKEKRQLMAVVEGLENAKKLFSQLRAKLKLRKHPGHQLLVSWKPQRASYKVGEPVTLELAIKNVGSTTVRFIEGGQQRGARDNQFGFTAFSGSGHGKPIPDTGDPRHFGGIGAFREIKPGETFRKQVDVTKWFKFEETGTYEITGIYELELRNKDFDFNALWDEYAIGRCRVRIVE